MKKNTTHEKLTVAERLLAKREAAGDNLEKYYRYHSLVRRYQHWMVKGYPKRGTFSGPGLGI